MIVLSATGLTLSGSWNSAFLGLRKFSVRRAASDAWASSHGFDTAPIQLVGIVLCAGR